MSEQIALLTEIALESPAGALNVEAALLYTFDATRLIVLRVMHAQQDLDAVRDSLS